MLCWLCICTESCCTDVDTRWFAERTLNFRSPMDFLFWLAIVNNIFSIFGFTGVMNQQKELVTGFFAYNAVQMIVSFHYFVDVCADVRIRYGLSMLFETAQPVQHQLAWTGRSHNTASTVQEVRETLLRVKHLCFRFSGEPTGLTAFERAAAGKICLA